MSAFLNYKYYLGGSFASWYWHYAPWGAVLAGLIEAGLLAVLQTFDAPPEARHVRGITLVSARKLARKLGSRAGIGLAGVRIPRALECQHFLISGWRSCSAFRPSPNYELFTAPLRPPRGSPRPPPSCS